MANFRENMRKIAMDCLAISLSVIVVVILAIIIFASDFAGMARGCYIFLKTKITEE